LRNLKLIKENEISVDNKFQWDPIKRHFVLFKKSQLQQFFTYFMNVPKQVNWNDNGSVITGKSPYTIQIKGFFYIETPGSKEEFTINFTLIAKVEQTGVFG
jgi:hypothetical protein